MDAPHADVKHHPAVASETPRQAIRRILATGPHTTYELSALVHAPEREIASHLEHLARSLQRGDERLEVEPSQCRGCGYVFRERQRLSRPGACPKCRSQHVSAPVFRISRRS